MDEIKILVMTNPAELGRTIEKYLQNKYVLVGPVTMGTNNNGNAVYVATLQYTGENLNKGAV